MARESETEAELGEQRPAVWRQLALLMLVAALAATATFSALAATATFSALGRIPPLYIAEARILVAPPSTTSRADEAQPDIQNDDSAIRTQMEVLRSHEIAEAVIDRLDLPNRPALDPATGPSTLRRLLAAAGLREHPVEEPVRQRIIGAFLSRLSVYPIGRSRVIGIEFEAGDPALAAEVANAVATIFVDMHRGSNQRAEFAASDWLDAEIARLRSRVAEAQRKIADYRRGRGLLTGSGTDGGLRGGGSASQLADLEAELARVRAARAEAEANAALIRTLLSSGDPLEASPEVLRSPSIQRLKERQIALRVDLADLSATLLPAHPRMRGHQRQLDDLNGQITSEAGLVLRSLENAARIAAAREQSLEQSVARARAAASAWKERDVELLALQREVGANRDHLERLLAWSREATARTGAASPVAGAWIISQAIPPNFPSSPAKRLISLAAALGTIVIGGSILMLRRYGRGKSRREMEPGAGAASNVETVAPAAVEDAEALPSAAVRAEEVPETVSVQPPADDADHAESRVGDPAMPEQAELIAALPAVVEGELPGTAALAEVLASPALRTMLFAGAAGGEDAGGVALAAARIAARHNLKIIVIDIGVRPAPALGGSEKPGLNDLLAGEASFGEVIRREEGTGLHFIPIGGPEGEGPYGRLPLVIGVLTHTYDKVIVVADTLADWPHEHFMPDCAAIICTSEISDPVAGKAYEAATANGARSALIVRVGGDEAWEPQSATA